jgi:predicted secreted protein
MASGAVKFQGTTFDIGTGDATTIAPGADVFIPVGEVVNSTGPDGEANEIEVTSSLSLAKEFLVGLPDEGNISLDMILVPADAGQVALRAAKNNQGLRNFQITLPDGTVLDLKARVKSFTMSGGTDDKWTASTALRISGPVTVTTP